MIISSNIYKRITLNPTNGTDGFSRSNPFTQLSTGMHERLSARSSGDFRERFTLNRYIEKGKPTPVIRPILFAEWRIW